MKKALYMLLGWTLSIVGVFTIYLLIGIAFIAAGGALIDEADKI